MDTRAVDTCAVANHAVSGGGSWTPGVVYWTVDAGELETATVEDGTDVEGLVVTGGAVDGDVEGAAVVGGTAVVGGAAVVGVDVAGGGAVVATVGGAVAATVVDGCVCGCVVVGAAVDAAVAGDGVVLGASVVSGGTVGGGGFGGAATNLAVKKARR